MSGYRNGAEGRYQLEHQGLAEAPFHAIDGTGMPIFTTRQIMADQSGNS